MHHDFNELSLDYSSYLREALNYIQIVQESLKADLACSPAHPPLQSLHQILNFTEREVSSLFTIRPDGPTFTRRLHSLFRDLDRSVSELVGRPTSLNKDLTDRLSSLELERRVQEQRHREEVTRQVTQVEAKYLKSLTKTSHRNAQLTAEVTSLRLQLQELQDDEDLEKTQIIWQDAMEETDVRFKKLREAVLKLNQACRDPSSPSLQSAELINLRKEREIRQGKETIGKMRLEHSQITSAYREQISSLQAELEALREMKTSDKLLVKCLAKLEALDQRVMTADATHDFNAFALVLDKFRGEIARMLTQATGQISRSSPELSSESTANMTLSRLQTQALELQHDLKRARSALKTYEHTQQELEHQHSRLQEADATVQALQESVRQLDHDNQALRSLVSTYENASTASAKHRRRVSSIDAASQIEIFGDQFIKGSEGRPLEGLRTTTDYLALCEKSIGITKDCRLLMERSSDGANRDVAKGVERLLEAINHPEAREVPQGKVDLLFGELKALTEAKEAAQAKVEQLSRELKVQTEARASAQAKVAQLSEELKQQTEPRGAAQIKEEQLLKELKLQTTAREAAQTRVEQLIADLKLKTEETHTAQTNETALRAQLQDQTSRLKTLQQMSHDFEPKAAELLSLKAKVKDLERSLAASQAKADSLAQSVSESTELRSKADKELASYKDKTKKQASQLTALKAKEQAAEKLRIETEQQHALAVKVLQVELSSLQEKYLKTKRDLKAAKDGEVQLKKKFMQRLEKFNEQTDTQLADLKAANATLEHELRDKEQELEVLMSELQIALGRGHSEISEQLAEVEQSMQDKDQKIESLQQEVLKLTSDLKAAEVIESSGKRDLQGLDTLKQELVMKEQQHASTDQALRELSNEYASACDLLKSAEAGSKALETKLKAAADELAEVKTDKAKVEASLEQMASGYKQLQTAFSEVKATLEQTAKAKNEAVQNLAEKSELLRSLQAEVSPLKESNQALVERAESSAELLKEADHKLKALNSEIADCGVRAKGVSGKSVFVDVVQLQQELKTSAENCTRLEVEAKKTHELVEFMSQEQQLSLIEISSLKKQLMTYQKDSAYSGLHRRIKSEVCDQYLGQRLAEDGFHTGELLEMETEGTRPTVQTEQSQPDETLQGQLAYYSMKQGTTHSKGSAEVGSSRAEDDVPSLEGEEGRDCSGKEKDSEIEDLRMELEERVNEIMGAQDLLKDREQMIEELQAEVEELREFTVRLSSLANLPSIPESFNEESPLLSIMRTQSLADELELLSKDFEVIKQQKENLSRLIAAVAAKAGITGSSDEEILRLLEGYIGDLPMMDLSDEEEA
jgi:chromosome segregation ATPase